MDANGICPHHRKNPAKAKKSIPDELLTPSSGLLVKVIHRLLHDLRKMFLEKEQNGEIVPETMQEGNGYNFN